MQEIAKSISSRLNELNSGWVVQPRAIREINEGRRAPMYPVDESDMKILLSVDYEKSLPLVTKILANGPFLPSTREFMHLLMSTSRGYNEKKPLPKNALHWILPVAKALGNDENNSFNLSSREIEDFFACFPYPEVRSYLIDPLIHSVQRQGKKKSPGEWVSARVVKVKAESFHLQYTYRAHYNLVRPILTGLVRSLNAMGKYSGPSDVLNGDMIGELETAPANPIALVPEKEMSYDEFLVKMNSLVQEGKVIIVKALKSISLKGELHVGEKVTKGRLVMNLDRDGEANDQWAAHFICDDTSEVMKLGDSSVQNEVEALQMAIKNGFVSKVK